MKMNWMNEEEMNQIQSVLNEYKNNKKYGNLYYEIEAMIINVDERLLDVFYKLFPIDYNVNKSAYHLLVTIFLEYRTFVISIIQNDSLVNIKKVCANLFDKIYDYTTCDARTYQSHELYMYDLRYGIKLSDQITCENYEIIKNFSYLRDILMFSITQSYDYSRYKELALSFKYVKKIRSYIIEERTHEDLKQDKLYQDNPLYVLERHPELVYLYDSEVLKCVKIDLLFKLNKSQYELENENQILEVVSNINHRLLLEKKED